MLQKENRKADRFGKCTSGWLQQEQSRNLKLEISKKYIEFVLWIQSENKVNVRGGRGLSVHFHLIEE